MRTFIALLLFRLLTANAQDSSDITTKVNERRNADGTVQSRIETTSRGKTPILRVLQSIKGGVTSTTRIYRVGGDTVMMESDEDGDGLFETMVVYHPAKTDMEVFTRQRDGSVKPVSTQTLEAHKKQEVAWTEFWEKEFDKNTDPDNLGDRIREMQQKLRDLEKEKTDGKK